MTRASRSLRFADDLAKTSLALAFDHINGECQAIVFLCF